MLAGHPGVAEAAVVGVPDERWGEVGEAYVVRRRGVAVDGQELAEHCAVRLAPFKRPARFRFVDELPHSGTGQGLPDAAARRPRRRPRRRRTGR